MADEKEFLRDQNVSLRAKIAGLEHQIDELVRRHSETYELNEILQKRLRENGLSPYVTASDLAAETQIVTASVDEPKSSPVTAKMLQVLREVVDGTSVDHGRLLAPRERAGRGRTLDKLQERGLLDSIYRPTERGKFLVSSANLDPIKQKR